MQWVTVLIVAAALNGWSCRLVQAQSVSEVLDKAEQALGGRVVLGDIQAIRTRSHGVLDLPSRGIEDVPFKAEVVFRRPDQIRVSWQFPEQLGDDFSFGYDGRDAWGIFGAPPARCKGWHRELVLHMAHEVQMFLVAPARAAYGDTFVVDATEDDSSALTKLTYRPLGSGGPWSVWFEKQTGNLVMLEHDAFQMDGSRVLGRITRSSPQRYGPLRYMSQAKFEAFRDGEVIETANETIDSLEINPELPGDFFACPQWEVDPASIGVKDVAEDTVVKFEHRGPYTEVGKTLGPAMDVISASGLVPVGAVSCTYHSDPATVAPQDLRATLAHGVTKVSDKAPELPAGYEFTTQPAMRVAYAYHRGDHMEEGEAHERLRAWTAEQGLQAVGPPRAIWFHDPEVTVTDDLVTEVQIPVEPRTGLTRHANPPVSTIRPAVPPAVVESWTYLIGRWDIEGHVGDVAVTGSATFELAADEHCYFGKQVWRVGPNGRVVHLALLGGWDPVENETVEHGFSSGGDAATVRYSAPKTVTNFVEGRIEGANGRDARYAGDVKLVRINNDEFRLTTTVDGELLHSLTYARKSDAE